MLVALTLGLSYGQCQESVPPNKKHINGQLIAMEAKTEGARGRPCKFTIATFNRALFYRYEWAVERGGWSRDAV